MDLMRLAAALAHQGFRVLLGPRDANGARPFIARRAGVVVYGSPETGPSLTLATPRRFTIS